MRVREQARANEGTSEPNREATHQAAVCCNKVLPEKLVMFDFLAAHGKDAQRDTLASGRYPASRFCEAAPTETLTDLDAFNWLYMWHSPSLQSEGRPCRKLVLASQPISRVKTTVAFQAKKAARGPLGVLMSRPDVVFSVLAAFPKRDGVDARSREETTAAVRAAKARFAASELIGHVSLTLTEGKGRKRSR
jgi:hypothetical protein